MQQAKCSTDDPDTDVYVDVSNSDPVYYESFQLKSLKISESMTMYNKAAADSDSRTVDKLVENEAYSLTKGKTEEGVVENIYDTIPGQFYELEDLYY